MIVQQGSLNAHNLGELGKSKERRSEVIITITNNEINTIIVLDITTSYIDVLSKHLCAIYKAMSLKLQIMHHLRGLSRR